MADGHEAESMASPAERLKRFYTNHAREIEHAMMTERFKAAMKPRYDPARFAAKVDEELTAVRETLIAKNANYGDSALNPVRIFSKLGAAEQLRVAIDHKLSRLARGQQGEEDTILDLMGYIILLRIAERDRHE